MNNVARTGWHLPFRVKSNVFTVVANTQSAELAARRGLGFFALLLPAACAASGSYSYGYGFAGSYSYGYGLAAPRTRIAAVDVSCGPTATTQGVSLARAANLLEPCPSPSPTPSHPRQVHGAQLAVHAGAILPLHLPHAYVGP